TAEYWAFKLWFCRVAEKARITFQFLLNPLAVVFGNKADRRPVAVGDEVLPELQRHGFSSVQALNGLCVDLRTSAINSRTRLRRLSMRSTKSLTAFGSIHSGGTASAIALSWTSGKLSIRLSQGSNECHPVTF